MKYALLLARQRSGTGALGSTLDKQPGLRYLGEVFHPDNVGDEYNFFTYLRERVASDPNDALPGRRFDLFINFLEGLAEKNDGATLIVDVKYRSMHHLDGGWRGVFQRPQAIEETIARQAPIIHLTRNNALRTFLSGRLADANQIWHARNEDVIAVNSTELNPSGLLNYIAASKREFNQIDRWTKNYARLSRFDYEDLFDDDGNLTAELADVLAKNLGAQPFADRTPFFKKQAPTDLKVAIKNYDEIANALKDTDAQWMLD